MMELDLFLSPLVGKSANLNGNSVLLLSYGERELRYRYASRKQSFARLVSRRETAHVKNIRA
ncbi:hypothetical protein D6D24_06360 [Aureobasidium pullulans]|uniref:Uncharacterized protein n=1 Tax=Aureobasidium pullulans TaxID=5580 RepID=A0A4S8VM19_AURPU|nr:hypothetical protein D6D24_06360 [Aureobasidium pullulans]